MNSRYIRSAGLLALTAAWFVSSAGRADAQSFTTFGYQRVGPRQVIAVPTYWQVRPTYSSTASHAFRRLVNSREYWKVTLQTRFGQRTRWYAVQNSEQAMRRAQRDFPNSSLIGVVKEYR